MELGINKPVEFTEGTDTFRHHMKPMTPEEYLQYTGDMGRTTKFIHRKRTVESTVDNQKMNRDRIKWWKRQVEKVEGYEKDGKDVMTFANWKDLIIQYVPQHCVRVMTDQKYIGEIGEQESEGSDDDSPLIESNSEPA